MKSKYIKTVIILGILILIMIISGFFSGFCDWYADNIYSRLCDAITFITTHLSFAVGEIIMFLGGALVVVAIILLPLLIILRKKESFHRFCVVYYKICSIVLEVTILIYLPTWYIPFNGTVLGRGKADLRTEFTYEEIEELIWYIVDNGNEAAEEINVAEDGSVIFRTPEESCVLSAEAMEKLGEEFPRLSGYYPQVKEAICSDILYRMRIGGYNYPYTMEPTRSRYVDPLYAAVLEAHELAHHKGYYKENEANFLSQLALSRSEDPYLRLAAFVNMYNYVYPDYIMMRDAKLEQMAASGEVDSSEISDDERREKVIREVFGEEPEFSDRVDLIREASADVRRAVYDADYHIIDSLPAVDDIIHKTADKGWSTQDEILKDNSYDGVVLLLLQYFYD